MPAIIANDNKQLFMFYHAMNIFVAVPYSEQYID